MIKEKNIRLNKKGLSEIITTALFILMAVVAVGLIWFAVHNLINKVYFSPSSFQNCLDIQMEKIVSIKNACYNTNTSDVEITILRQPSQINIESLNFIINLNNGDVIKYNCGSGCSNCRLLSESQEKTYYAYLNNIPDSVKVAVSNCILDEKKLGDC